MLKTSLLLRLTFSKLIASAFVDLKLYQ